MAKLNKKTVRPADGASEDAFDVVARYFNRPDYVLLPKHLRLHRAFHDAISRGDLAPEMRLPPELEVARRLGISLGTAQRALGQLAAEGLIRRRQGQGTFVAERQIPEEELWQFRFLRDVGDRQYVSIFAMLRELRGERGTGRWSEMLGTDQAGYVYIERLIHGSGEVRCLSRMYLPASRFGAVLDGRLAEANPLNIKLLLRREFGAHTTATEQILSFVLLDAHEAGVLMRQVGETAIRFEATGLDQSNAPITYHEIIVPRSEYLLDMTFTGVPRRATSRIVCHAPLKGFVSSRKR